MRNLSHSGPLQIRTGKLKLAFKLVGLSADYLSDFFFSSRRRHTRSDRDWSSDVCSSDLGVNRDAIFGGEGDGRSFKRLQTLSSLSRSPSIGLAQTVTVVSESAIVTTKPGDRKSVV